MTKKEFWEKKKYKVGKESWNKCDFCLNQCEWLAYIGDYSYADGAYICEKCFVGEPLKCVMCGDEINEEDVWCNECLGVDDDY